MRRPSFLVSYAFLRQSTALLLWARRLRDLGHGVLIDSGAFSAWRSGAEIGVEEYCSFLAKEDWIERYIQLDVLNDAEASMRNLATMRAAGLDPIPVLVATAETTRAAELVAGCARRAICVAGGTGLGRDETEGWYRARVATVRRIVGDDCWIHCLGYTRGIAEIATLPANSFDSSTWGSSQRYGIVQLFSSRRLLSRQVPIGIKAGARAFRRSDLRSMFLDAGVGPADSGKAASRTEGKVVAATHDAFIRLHEVAAAAGKEVHYAAMSPRQLGLLREAWERRAKEKRIEP